MLECGMSPDREALAMQRSDNRGSVQRAQRHERQQQTDPHFDVPRPLGNLNLRQIADLVEKRYGMPPGEIRKQTNAPRIVQPRQVAMYLMIRHTHFSYPAIGRFFKNMHHTTVMYGVRRVTRAVETQADFRIFINELEEAVKALPSIERRSVSVIRSGFTVPPLREAL